MADLPLFDLDTEARWRLAYDPLQWIVQHRVGKVRVGHIEGHAIADSGWRGTDYIGSEKRILRRCIAERGIVLSPEAQARLDALPKWFADFLVVAAEHVDQSYKARSRPEKGTAIAISGKEASPYLAGEIAPGQVPAAADHDGLDHEVAA